LGDARDEIASALDLSKDRAVSAARSSGELPRRRESMPTPPADIARLRVRRREARRRRQLARIDLGLGVLGALVLWIATPGLAIAALIAGIVLAACVTSFVVQRRRRAGREALLRRFARQALKRSAPRERSER
jgi:Flp pilus assembly protein TadB